MTHLYTLTDRQQDALLAILNSRTIDLVTEEMDDLKAALNRKVGFPGAVFHFSQAQAANEPELKAYADAAPNMNCVSDGVCEIDTQGPVTIISKGEDDGAYALAWVWVSNRDAGLPSIFDDLNEDEVEGDDA